MQNIPAGAENYVPNFDYELLSLSAVPDEKILRLCEDSLLDGMMMAMKKARDRDFLVQHFESFFNLFENRPQWNQNFDTTAIR